MKTNPVLTAVLALAVVAASSCATQRIVSQWSNPAYANPLRSTDKVVVVGVMEEEAIRRNFEDHLVVKLRAAGIDALPGYRTIPQTGVGVDARLKAALQDSGADAALITRLVRLEQRSEVSPGYSDFYRLGILSLELSRLVWWWVFSASGVSLSRRVLRNDPI